MKNLMTFFLNSYERYIKPYEDSDPVVEKMKDEIRSLIDQKEKMLSMLPLNMKTGLIQLM